MDGIISGLKALLYNRFGDIGVLVGLVICVAIQCDCGLDLLPFSCSLGLSYSANSCLLLVSVGFITGLFSKSALLGLHSWLLDSMKGLTPVSALLHSATLVCAGIVLSGKMDVLLGYLDNTGLVVGMGITSCIVASWIGQFFTDTKRVVAYSTLIHIGLMASIVGASFLVTGYSMGDVSLDNVGIGLSAF